MNRIRECVMVPIYSRNGWWDKILFVGNVDYIDVDGEGGNMSSNHFLDGRYGYNVPEMIRGQTFGYGYCCIVGRWEDSGDISVTHFWDGELLSRSYSIETVHGQYWYSWQGVKLRSQEMY